MVEYSYEHLLERFSAFTKLLHQQKGLLIKHDYKSLAEMQKNELQALHNWYQAFFLELEKGTEFLHQLTAPQKEKIREVYSEFAQLLADNTQILGAKIEVENAVTEAIYKAISENVVSNPVYEQDGSCSSSSSARIHSLTV